MRLLRVLLLVLLAVTLPVRGVMAAALLCPPHADAAAAAHAMGAAGESRASHHHGGTAPDDASSPSGHSHDGSSATDTCNLCSACCSVPPVPSAAPALLLPHDAAATVFPSVAAPAPTFQSEGPERPPRSI